MIAPPLALSLSNSVTEVGAIAAFVALLGIAVLSLLVFSQAREIKRLREWAGRAPERAAEVEQRISADAASRVQRAATPAGSAAQGGRVVPRKTPLVSAPVSTAVNATVAASGLRGQSAPDSPVPTQATPPEGSPDSATMPADLGQGAPLATPHAPVAADAESARADKPAAAPLANGAVGAETPAEPAQSAGPQVSAGEPASPAPATAAARTTGVAARAPLPPSPAAPAPPGASSAGVLPGPSTAAAQSPKPASRPPAPVAAARSVPSRAVAGSASAVPPRVASVGSPVRASGPKYFKPERRSPNRRIAAIVGGAIVGVLVIVLAASALKGGSGSGAAAPPTSSTEATHTTTTRHTTTTTAASATPPGETAVVVLNGTSTAGLAHHLASDLQQGGYVRAAALAGVPSGTHASTVVEYAHGHRADAQAVAKALNVIQVQAIDPSTASLAGSATVVVLAGADQASQLGGGGAQSKGEPAASVGGESAAASG